MPGELLQAVIVPTLGISDAANFGQSAAIRIGEGMAPVLAVAGTLGYLAFKAKLAQGGDSHQKPAEIREARVKMVKPWESGLLLKNSSFYESVPVLGANGKQLEIEGELQFAKDFHKVIVPGLNGGLNLIDPRRKMVLVNNLPDEATFQMTHIQDEDKHTYNLTGGMAWAHVRALDEHKRPKVYNYLEPSPDGKRPAGPISAAEALHNAIMTAPTRAEAARQLVIIVLPEVRARLDKESDPQRTAIEPAFFVDVEKAVHDRFLERGSVFLQLNVTPNVNPETVAAGAIAKAMNKRTKILKNSNNGSRKIQLGQDASEEDETAAAAITAGINGMAGATQPSA